jgi:hypothetical protein
MSLINEASLNDLVDAWNASPFPSIKTSSYFRPYVKEFSHLRGQECTFVETGILDGGSLFMWRKWLGDGARIIGIDMNPEARKWEREGFEIHIGDQGDPAFWRKTLPAIGHIDGFLDDGGHQSFQQIVTVRELIAFLESRCVIVVEDTYTSFMNDFAAHGNHSFLEFAKDATDCVLGRSFGLYPDRFPKPHNLDAIKSFQKVFAINFYSGIVAFQIDPSSCVEPKIVRNKAPAGASDYRYQGMESAVVDWPNVLAKEVVLVKGGQ